MHVDAAKEVEFDVGLFGVSDGNGKVVAPLYGGESEDVARMSVGRVVDGMAGEGVLALVKMYCHRAGCDCSSQGSSDV